MHVQFDSTIMLICYISTAFFCQKKKSSTNWTRSVQTDMGGEQPTFAFATSEFFCSSGAEENDFARGQIFERASEELRSIFKHVLATIQVSEQIDN